MFKYLYKTFLITCLSWSLLIMQSNALLAQTASSPNGMTTTDSNGIITHTQSYEFNKIKDSDMLASITMLAGGFVTGRMLASYRPLTMDVMIAGAAGAAFIAGEIMSNMKFKGVIDAMTLEVQRKTDGTVNEEQIQRLRDLRQSYEEAKKATKTKKTLQLAAAVGFGAAAAASTYMAITEDTMAATCTATLSAAQTALASTSASPTEAAANAKCLPLITSYQTAFAKFLTTRVKPMVSIKLENITGASESFLEAPSNYCTGLPGATVSAIAAKVGSSCSTTVVNHVMNQVNGNVVKVSNSKNSELLHKFLGTSPAALYAYENSKKQETGIFSEISNLLIPRAEAGWMPLLGLGAATAASFFLITGATAFELDLMMFVPRNRAIAFALFAGLAFMASKSSDNVLKKIEENLAKIDAILADLNKLAIGSKAQNIAKTNIAIKTVNPATKNIQGTEAVSKSNTPCLTSNDTANCEVLENKLSSMPGFSALPESFRTLATETMKVGNGVSGANGISGSTLSAADSLGGKANAIKNLLKNRTSALEKRIGNKYDSNKEKDKFQARLAARIKKELGKSGTTATGMMANLGTSPIDSSGIPKEDVAEELKKDAAAANITDISAPASKDDSMKLDFSDGSSGGTIAGSGAGSSSNSPEYDIPENQISGENGPSIFEVISSRYIKSGYPKLLDEAPSNN